jgi:hypothetical protein
LQEVVVVLDPPQKMLSFDQNSSRYRDDENLNLYLKSGLSFSWCASAAFGCGLLGGHGVKVPPGLRRIGPKLGPWDPVEVIRGKCTSGIGEAAFFHCTFGPGFI